MSSAAYSLSDLCGLAEVTPRTVRYYVSQGILRSPGSGPRTRYDDGHLARLRLVRQLQRQHLPLAEIRARLAALTDGEAITEAQGPAERPRGSALDYVRDALAARTLGPPAMPLHRSARPPVELPTDAAPGISDPHVLREGRPWLPAPQLKRTEGVGPAPPPAEHASTDPLLDTPARLAGPSVSAEPAPGTVRSSWERYALTPDVELHVRRPLARSQNRAVARLLKTARQILEEDQP